VFKDAADERKQREDGRSFSNQDGEGVNLIRRDHHPQIDQGDLAIDGAR
jgi:hypothetical protein